MIGNDLETDPLIMKSPLQPLSRRHFLKTSGAFAAFTILSSRSWANSPNGRLQVAQVGVGGRGAIDLKSIVRLDNVDVVALCDVDSLALDEAAILCPKATRFSDYRKMLEAMDSRIDAVMIATPDHMHAPVSTAAMELGKHVYCEKPLAHNVHENRELRLLSEKNQLVTQLGIQNSAGLGYRMTSEYIRGGLIGKVSEVHVWSNKEWGRDEPTMSLSSDPVPGTLEWDLWQGIAPEHVYKDDFYHPGNWRKLIDFGTGTLGDMGVHIFDTPYRVLELTAPNWVRTTCRQPNGFSHPSKNMVEYEFPSTSRTTEKLKWRWYDGQYAPLDGIKGIELPEGRKLPEQGCVLVGEKGSLLVEHKSGPQTLPAELIRSVPRPKLKPIDHHGQWANACLGDGKTGSPFSYGGPLCEALQLGVVAARFPGKKLKWNAEAMQVTNIKAANRYLARTYRAF